MKTRLIVQNMSKSKKTGNEIDLGLFLEIAEENKLYTIK